MGRGSFSFFQGSSFLDYLETLFPILKEPSTEGPHPCLVRGCDPGLQMVFAWRPVLLTPLSKVCGCTGLPAVVPCPLESCRVTLPYMAPTPALLRPPGYPLVSLVAALPLCLAQEHLAPHTPIIHYPPPPSISWEAFLQLTQAQDSWIQCQETFCTSL